MSIRNDSDTAHTVGAVSAKWYADWQSADHARLFDGRQALDDRNLLRNYESFNDVRLLNERVDRSRSVSFLEVGCATGEFYRYLRIRYPQVDYYGIDISQSAIARAQQKYQRQRFFVSDPNMKIVDTLKALGIPGNREVVYAKDVVHHQTDPLEFICQLLHVTSEALIMRVRTREVGQTVTDPELSCQYHYHGWMPYIVINLQELVDHITSQVPGCNVVVYRNHVVLGGRENRFLPKECYLPETGTAETAVGVFLKTNYPGRIQIEDWEETAPRYSLSYRSTRLFRRVLHALIGPGVAGGR